MTKRWNYSENTAAPTIDLDKIGAPGAAAEADKFTFREICVILGKIAFVLGGGGIGAAIILSFMGR